MVDSGSMNLISKLVLQYKLAWSHKKIECSCCESIQLLEKENLYLILPSSLIYRCSYVYGKSKQLNLYSFLYMNNTAGQNHFQFRVESTAKNILLESNLHVFHHIYFKSGLILYSANNFSSWLQNRCKFSKYMDLC